MAIVATRRSPMRSRMRRVRLRCRRRSILRAPARPSPSCQQALLCKYTTANPATIQGKAKYDKIQINVSVAFEGTQNSLFNCIINGGGGTGYCVDVFSGGSAFPQTHVINTADISNCSGSAVQVESGSPARATTQVPGAVRAA